MVLALENSVPPKHRKRFPRLFSVALAVITLLYIAFGVCGYASFGPLGSSTALADWLCFADPSSCHIQCPRRFMSAGRDTEKIITLNMPPGIFPMLVKGCLCFSLFFTYPVMMLPVSTILDKAFGTQSKSMTSMSGVRGSGFSLGARGSFLLFTSCFLLLTISATLYVTSFLVQNGLRLSLVALSGLVVVRVVNT